MLTIIILTFGVSQNAQFNPNTVFWSEKMCFALKTLANYNISIVSPVHLNGQDAVVDAVCTSANCIDCAHLNIEFFLKNIQRVLSVQ